MNTKEYYSQKELIDFKLTPLKERALCFRFAKLVREGKLVIGVNLFRNGKSWAIHKSMIPQFQYQSILDLELFQNYTL